MYNILKDKYFQIETLILKILLAKHFSVNFGESLVGCNKTGGEISTGGGDGARQAQQKSRIACLGGGRGGGG